MLFKIDTTKKIIFGWSAKCGCSHVKCLLNYLIKNIINFDLRYIHSDLSYHNRLPDDGLEDFTIILFMNNPYRRLISGFIDKYRKNGEYRKKWIQNICIFNDFVSELVTGNWKQVDYHHFTPQTTEYFDEYKINKAKKLIVCDIKNIDYNYISNLYQKIIPDNIINYKGNHAREKFNETITEPLYNKDLCEYYNKNFDYNLLYSESIKNTVYEFYKNDFIFLSKYNLYYDSA
jgi:hypothetical protein